MRPEHLHILQHALGLDEFGQGVMYRNSYVTDDGDKDCTALVTAGLMIRHAPRALFGGDPCFTVTEAGKAAMREHSPPPPRVARGRARYLAWLSAADAYDIAFGDWLKGRRPA